MHLNRLNASKGEIANYYSRVPDGIISTMEVIIVTAFVLVVVITLAAPSSRVKMSAILFLLLVGIIPSLFLIMHGTVNKSLALQDNTVDIGHYIGEAEVINYEVTYNNPSVKHPEGEPYITAELDFKGGEARTFDVDESLELKQGDTLIITTRDKPIYEDSHLTIEPNYDLLTEEYVRGYISLKVNGKTIEPK